MKPAYMAQYASRGTVYGVAAEKEQAPQQNENGEALDHDYRLSRRIALRGYMLARQDPCPNIPFAIGLRHRPRHDGHCKPRGAPQKARDQYTYRSAKSISTEG